ncbi:MAG: metal ABC transporter permease [Parvibaculales bacterium]
MIHANEFMMFLAALLICLMAAPLGCLIFWRRMAYFGDALSHSALLGVGLGFLFGGHVFMGGAIVCAIFAVLLVWLESRFKLTMDTLLGILAHGSLAFGILALMVFGNYTDETHQQTDAAATPPQTLESAEHTDSHDSLHAFEGYFFGDIEQAASGNIIYLAFAAVLVLFVLRRNWQSLILTILSEDLAKAEGHNLLRLKYTLIGCLTLTVAIAVQTVGVLFTTSLLILPAACARQWARNPKNMVIYAIGVAIASLLSSFTLSQQQELPFGPVLTAFLCGFFALSLIFSVIIRKKSPRI